MVIANGVADHYHVLTYAPARIAVAQLVQNIKSGSSSWLSESGYARHFDGWQTGYFADTVSWHDIEKVRRYIANQEEHHRTETFQEEYRRLLREANVDYDEEYLWG